MQRKHLTRWAALVAVSSLVGAGTAAFFTDSETSASNSIVDGTLDLTLGGPSQTTPAVLTDRAPGDSGSHTFSLTNDGSLTGYLSFSLEQVADTENGCNEAETSPAPVGEGPDCNLDDNGELDEKLDVDVSVSDLATPYEGILDAHYGEVRDLGSLAAGASRIVTVDWTLPGATTGNEIQSDGATFTLNATLHQNPLLSAFGFEDGTLDGWTADPTTLVTASGVVDKQLVGGPLVTFSPQEGDFFALLEAGQQNVYTTLSRSFTVSAGQTVNGQTFFQAGDYTGSGYNDDGRVIVVDPDGITETVLFSANVDGVGSYNSTGWQPLTHTFTAAGTYVLKAQVRNIGDSGFPSYLGLDAVNVG